MAQYGWRTGIRLSSHESKITIVGGNIISSTSIDCTLWQTDLYVVVENENLREFTYTPRRVHGFVCHISSNGLSPVPLKQLPFRFPKSYFPILIVTEINVDESRASYEYDAISALQKPETPSLIRGVAMANRSHVQLLLG